MTVRRALLACVCLLVTAPAAAAAPSLHAHRGGTVQAGRPVAAEETLRAYSLAARDGFVLEVDAKLTRDGVPVAIHDATLERTTDCRGLVRARTLDELSGCRPDVLGSPGSGLPTRRVTPRGSIPTIERVLRYARAAGAQVNLEIKNVPTDADYDPTPAYAERVMDVVLSSGIAREQLLIQSFLPAHLDVARRRLPGVATSLLSLGATVDAFLDLAVRSRYDWISPEWPVSRAYVRRAHRAGVGVAPYTLNRAADVRTAARAGADAIISDDPLAAATTLGRQRARRLRAAYFADGTAFRANGVLGPPADLARRSACRGTVTVRVSTHDWLVTRQVRLDRDCRFRVRARLAGPVPAPGLAVAVRFGGNRRLLPRVVVMH